MAEHEPTTPSDASSFEASGQVAPTPIEHAHENTRNPIVDGDPPQDQPHRGMLPFSVVGLGASAGGLDAYMELLQSLAPDTGMAFVVVPHLSPDHESRMSEILSRYTTMPVEPVVDGVRPEPDHVYVLPPGKQVFISSGLLRLAERPAAGHGSMTIDRFLCSLAVDQKTRALGVVLSGTDSDGALGLRNIKAEGGISIVQDPDSAQFESMPRSAILADHVDLILPPAEIGRELNRIGRGLIEPEVKTLVQGDLPEDDERHFNRVLVLLRGVQGIDFRLYKPATLRRRTARRMMLRKVASLSEYAALLQEDPEEVRSLHEDALINVTRFFRDPEVFDAVRNQLLPAILENRPVDQQLRIWVAGCATGEEAYSIAMCVSEHLYAVAAEPPVVIFGTDASEQSIQKARAAVYPESIHTDVSPERLRRFFVKTDHGYQVSKRIRDLCIFARQNLCNDPPYSRLDLVSCRNVLIYLGHEIQRRIMTTFHYALRPTGRLLLGNAESIRDNAGLFTSLDRKHRIYGKVSKEAHILPDMLPRMRGVELPRFVPAAGPKGLINEPELQRAADRIVLARYTPAGVVVNDRMEVLQVRGNISPYLHIAPGTASLNLMRMAREGLSSPLRDALQRAFLEEVPIAIENLSIRTADSHLDFTIDILPIHGVSGQTRTYLIVFLPSAPQAVSSEATSPIAPGTPEELNREVVALRKDIASTRLYLNSLIEERDNRNQELTSAYEELQSANEELQSTNEELETAKEELQATNEEIQTVNEELRNRNAALVIASNDLSNLLTSVNIPVIMVANDFTIKLYTPPAERLMRIRRQDIGRPITEIRLNLMIEELEPLLQSVLDTLVLKELEVRDREGKWHLLRVRPYRTTDNKIDGLVMVLLDIDHIRRAEEAMRVARDFSASVIETVPVPFVVLDDQLRLRSANNAFRLAAGLGDSDLQNRSFPELTQLLWNLSDLRSRLQEVTNAHEPARDVQFEHEIPGPPVGVLRFTARPVTNEGKQWLLIVVEDISVAKRAERLLVSERDHLTGEVRNTAAELGQTRGELRALAARLITVQEEERRRVARELHDDIGQKLAMLDIDTELLRVHVVPGSEEARKLLESFRERMASVSREVRTISHRLHPSVLDDLGLTPAVKSLVEEFGQRENMPVSFKARNVPDSLPSDAAAALYRITQEALRNVAKHAGHTQVKVTLNATADKLRLTIRDFGEGFDMGELRERGLGLISMQERARLVHGQMEFHSELGEGTTISVTVPLLHERVD